MLRGGVTRHRFVVETVSRGVVDVVVDSILALQTLNLLKIVQYLENKELEVRRGHQRTSVESSSPQFILDCRANKVELITYKFIN